MFRKLLYSRLVTAMLHGLFSLFYSKEYLAGKFFEEKRIGYLWCLQGLFRIPLLRRTGVTWPVGRNTQILNGRNIIFDPSSINVFQQSGCYYQALEKLVIGKDVWIGPNVGIITANHNPQNPEQHLPGESVVLGDGCWIGMNSLILPGVILGDHVTVGGGSVVTHSFPEGNCVVAGVPAKLIRRIGQ